MSGRLRVGVIGQTMRAAYCRSYFAEPVEAPAVILTDDPGAFADWSRPAGVEVVRIVDDGEHLRQKLRRRMRREAIEWLRSGSVAGARVEKAISRLRPAPREVRTGGVGADSVLRHGLIRHLDALHEGTVIDVIVVFDLFDLPSVLEFSARTKVPVLVR